MPTRRISAFVLVASYCHATRLLLRFYSGSTRCAVNVCVFQRVKVPPGKDRLPSSNRSGGRGNKPVGAFDGKDHVW